MNDRTRVDDSRMTEDPTLNPTKSTIRQHRPGFVSGFDNEFASFDTIAQLLAVPFVANFSTRSNFHQFSICDDGTLMAEYNEGRKWWVVGFITDDRPALPQWTPVV